MLAGLLAVSTALGDAAAWGISHMAVPGLGWVSASPKEQVLSSTIFLPSPVGDTTITPMDVLKDVEWYVPASSYSQSHGWRFPHSPNGWTGQGIAWVIHP